MRRNMSVDYSAVDKYSTDLFTDEAVRLIHEHDKDKGPIFMYLAHLAPHTGNADNPFQAPDEEIAKFAHIEDPERRVYAGEFPLSQEKKKSLSWRMLKVILNCPKKRHFISCFKCSDPLRDSKSLDGDKSEKV